MDAIRKIEELTALVERLKQEAQNHAAEARGANATIYEIYQLCTGATGEPGNWHGAEPVRQTLASKEAELVRLREVIKITEQAVREMSHAYQDPNWFTEGKAGANKQFYLWKGKAQEAFATATQPPKEPT